MTNIQPIPDSRRTTRMFLEEAAPLILEEVKAEVDLRSRPGGGHWYELTWPPIFLFCKSKECNGDHFFDPDSEVANLGHLGAKLFFLIYTGRNRKNTVKLFGLQKRRKRYGGQYKEKGRRGKYGQ